METQSNEQNEQGDSYLDLTLNAFPTVTSYNDPSIAQFVASFDSSSNTELPAQIITEIGQTSQIDNTSGIAIMDRYDSANAHCVHTSNVLQQIYYSTDNDVLELQSLLLSWNLQELLNFFVRT